MTRETPAWLERLRRRQQAEYIEGLRAKVKATGERWLAREAEQRRVDAALNASILAHLSAGVPWFDLPVELLEQFRRR